MNYPIDFGVSIALIPTGMLEKNKMAMASRRFSGRRLEPDREVRALLLEGLQRAHRERHRVVLLRREARSAHLRCEPRPTLGCAEMSRTRKSGSSSLNFEKARKLKKRRPMLTTMTRPVIGKVPFPLL